MFVIQCSLTGFYGSQPEKCLISVSINYATNKRICGAGTKDKPNITAFNFIKSSHLIDSTNLTVLCCIDANNVCILICKNNLHFIIRHFVFFSEKVFA